MSVEHKKNTRRYKDLRREIDVGKQDKVIITIERSRKIIGRMPNWN